MYRPITGALTALLALAAGTASAQTKYPPRVGAFAISKIYNGATFSRCVADYNNPAQLRLHWFAADRAYAISVPASPYTGAAPAMYVSLDGGAPIKLQSNGDRNRPGAPLSSDVVDKVMAAKRSIAVKYAAASYTWNINGTNMTNVFVAMENCVFSVIRK